MRSDSKTQDGQNALNGSRLTDCEDGQDSAFPLASLSWRSWEKTVRERAQFYNARHRPIGLQVALLLMKHGLRRISFPRLFGRKLGTLKFVFLFVKERGNPDRPERSVNYIDLRRRRVISPYGNSAPPPSSAPQSQPYQIEFAMRVVSSHRWCSRILLCISVG